MKGYFSSPAVLCSRAVSSMPDWVLRLCPVTAGVGYLPSRTGNSVYPGQELDTVLLTGGALQSTGSSKSSTGTCMLRAGSREHNPCPQMLPAEGWEKIGAFCLSF